MNLIYVATHFNIKFLYFTLQSTLNHFCVIYSIYILFRTPEKLLCVVFCL